jgi:hypothetical protein
MTPGRPDRLSKTVRPAYSQTLAQITTSAHRSLFTPLSWQRSRPLLSLADRVERRNARRGWACGLCSMSDCSPRRRVATVARTTEGESSENSPRPPPFLRRPSQVYPSSTPVFRWPWRSSARAEAASVTSVSDGSHSSMNRCSQRNAARSQRAGSAFARSSHNKSASASGVRPFRGRPSPRPERWGAVVCLYSPARAG